MDMKKILQAMDGIAVKPVEGSNAMAKFLQVVTEGATPHKVALPVQMAMQHYQLPRATPAVASTSTSLLKKYFEETESVEAEQIAEEQSLKEQRIKQYSQQIAQRVLMKESTVLEKDLGKHNNATTGFKALAKKTNSKIAGAQFQKMKAAGQLEETPIDMTGDPNDPTVYGHEKANPMSLKGRIGQARAQLKELAQLAESNDLVAWEKITRLAKGGMFMGLEQNLEQIRHGIEQLAAKRKQGGIASRGIDKNIGEDNDPCWKDYKQVGTKKKGGRTVPNCVPEE